MRSALLFVLALAFPLSAHAFNLTGTWEGKYTCKGFDETGFAKIKTKENGTGSFKATTTYYLGAPREVATCKWSYKRIDTADPAVLSCLP